MNPPFIIYPAIDLRHGQVVRLKYGDPKQQTVFGHDPVAMGQKWIEAGSTWLHVVNLDGAFDEKGAKNWQVLPYLIELGAKVQFGGGIRNYHDIERALQLGVSRVLLGTVAVEKPHLVAEAIQRFEAAHIAVALDARDGYIKTRGWQDETAISAIELGQQMQAIGVTTAIHTDIGRDGVLTGVNVAESARLAHETGLGIIASGGVSTEADIEACLQAQGVTGVIVGRALYDGRIDLANAIGSLSTSN